MQTIAIDTETFYSSKLKYSVRTMIAEQYVRSPLFDPYLISVSDGKSSWAGEPKNFNWSCLDGARLLSHNRYFDQTVLEEMHHRGWAPKINWAEWHCTADLASYRCNRRALANAMEHLFGERVDKTVRAEANNRHWKDFLPEEREAMIKYAHGDARDCWRLWDRFSPEWPEWERRLSDQTIRQGMRGVQINAGLLHDYICQTHEMKLNTEKLLPWLDDTWDDSDEFNQKPTSTKCIAEQCRRVGIPCPPGKTDDEEGFVAWEATYGQRYPWIAALSSWRSVNKLYQTFVLMKARLRADGTMPFGLKYFGAHTGRWSGDGKINLQNPRKLPVMCNEHGLMETSDDRVRAALKEKKDTGALPSWVRHVIDFRALIVPRPGKRMVVCDLSQIEPRVLNWLAGNKVMLEMLRGGMAIYEVHARLTMGWTGGKLSKENPAMYALAKARVLSLGYQAGWEKFILMAGLYGIDITAGDPEWEVPPGTDLDCPEGISGYGMNSRKTVAEFRRDNSKIVELWGRMDSGFKQSVQSDYTVTLPSGRKLRYEKVRCERRIEPDYKTKKPVHKSVFTADTNGRRTTYYGGKLVENATQAVARDVFATHLLALDDLERDCVLFSAHDEAVCEVSEDLTKDDIERTMSVTPDWLEGCPIGAEAKEVPHYTK